MDLAPAFDDAADMMREIPRSGLLIATVAAMRSAWIGAAIVRRTYSASAARSERSARWCSAILVVVVLQVSRFDPRLDIAVPQLGLPEQTVAGGETRVPLAPDGHFWIQASINGVDAPIPGRYRRDPHRGVAPRCRAAGLEPRGRGHAGADHHRQRDGHRTD